jgi:hypothetical protein
MAADLSMDTSARPLSLGYAATPALYLARR